MRLILYMLALNIGVSNLGQCIYYLHFRKPLYIFLYIGLSLSAYIIYTSTHLHIKKIQNNYKYVYSLSKNIDIGISEWYGEYGKIIR